MRLVLCLIVASVAGAAAVSAAAHPLLPTPVSRIHDGGMCWDPDIEFPVPCDEDD
ncbi:hypothetical protein [Hyphomicrobium sp.]|uniref:hypothetical protein n=1 Tax=Hyphomicrobium sp. TaxID=82 RepID=UPI002D77E9AC|nr:hypothetical protein [Hyphomicrobium sp.]HET6388266.1 hypothetical protein [Hyphomicrobium sp.]